MRVRDWTPRPSRLLPEFVMRPKVSRRGYIGFEAPISLGSEQKYGRPKELQQAPGSGNRSADRHGSINCALNNGQCTAPLSQPTTQTTGGAGKAENLLHRYGRQQFHPMPAPDQVLQIDAETLSRMACDFQIEKQSQPFDELKAKRDDQKRPASVPISPSW